MQHVCDWSRFDELSALQRRDALDPGQRISPFSLLSIPSTPAEQLASAKSFAARRVAAMAGYRERPGPSRGSAPTARIRLGYLSADFREHAVAHLVAELLELHDRRRFEVVGYSYGPDDASPMRTRLMRACDAFVDVRELSHPDAAARIRGDNVSILVDLQGYTTHARTEIAALRPAPLAVSFLGYTGTMGADFIDYIVVDSFAVPDAAARSFTEKLVRMPGSFQANDRQRRIGATPSRAQLGLPDGAFVFCCFNQSFKILPEVFAAWMRLLAAVEGSVLWLLETNPWAAGNLRREAGRAGVDPARMVFAPFVPQEAHLGRMRAADLVLDTRPYNAHTTSSDALWVGVPVVTFPGDTLASRVAGSLLRAVDLPDLIVSSMAEYEALAARLARGPSLLAEVRARLERNRPGCALFDTPAYVRHLESAYARMWERHLRGDPPGQIDL
jgi:predicted O-linked N-acetylglucosamine transferase (SPINDLY family)